MVPQVWSVDWDAVVQGSGGARRRRRGLYGPPPRLTRTSPLAGRLLWHIGDWGRASEHIGGRWEQVGGELARERLGPGNELVVLAARPGRMAEVLASGLPHADALRAWRGDGRLMLEPLDFKWSLETASARQVSRDTLLRLLEAELPGLRAELDGVRALLEIPEHAPVETMDGRFVAPAHPANEAALKLDPQLASLVLPVDAQAFFRPLPEWPTARVLARIEGCELERMRSLPGVERYYRLGAGVAGALARLETGLFEDEPRPVDAAALVEGMRRAGRLRDGLNGLLLELERRSAARRALEERLAQLPRTALPFNRFRTELARLGVPRATLERRGGLGRAYGQVLDDVSAAIRAEGRRLVASGTSEAEALDALAAQPERWAEAARWPTAQQAKALRRFKEGSAQG
jgi:hypothetical protein